MVTHYTLQTKDHKLPLKEQDLSIGEFTIIRHALINYQREMENTYASQVKDGLLPDVVKLMKEVLEDIDKVRKKLDGID